MWSWSEAWRRDAPPGFVSHDTGRARLWLREDVSDALRGFEVEQPARLAARHPGPASGRGRVGLLTLPDARLIVRPYLRGGLVGLLLHDRYLDSSRAFAELELYEEARRRGIPTLEPLGAVTRSCRGFGFRHGIITRFLDGVSDLAGLLLAPTPWPALRAAAAAAGGAIRAMHEGGFDHPDLNIKNILIRLPEEDEGEPEAWIIDFDRGRFVDGSLPAEACESNLLRLLRSFAKFSARNPGALIARVPLALARGYFGEDVAAREGFLQRAREALRRSPRLAFSSWRAARGRDEP